MKLVFLDIGLAIDTYIFQRERTIRIQQEAIREIPTPVLQVRERLLIVPIIGVLDSTRARRLTDQLLQAIRDNRAKVVVLDITVSPRWTPASPTMCYKRWMRPGSWVPLSLSRACRLRSPRRWSPSAST
jgi:hypothetical protein